MRNIIKTIIAAAFVLLAVSAPQNSYAQSMHVIIACNTTDRNIGDAMVVDMRHVSNMIQTIAAALPVDLNYQEFDGHTCTKTNITNYINEMEVGRDDIVFFYYGGHGTHAKNDSDDPWPQMCMNSNLDSQYFPLKHLDKQIASKQPRLQIIFTDCCNMPQEGVSVKTLYAKNGARTELSKFSQEAIEKLFMESKGKIIMTSSKVGQFSWCGSGGSVFTNNALYALEEVGTGKLNPDWKTFCKSVRDRTLESRYGPEQAAQEPYFTISEVVDNDAPVPPRSDNHVDAPMDLFKALQTLVDHKVSIDERLDRMSAVMNKHFTSNAHVVTVGRNGTTRVLYEDVADFLRRLALSTKIKQINILEGDKYNKNSIITVHEVLY